MAQGTEAPKRRGRPRLNDEERKRHTMTFRMRDDLRAAVEELAQANGRSLSEQIEYYVEASVRSEAVLINQYSTETMSPTLLKAITVRKKEADGAGLGVQFPAGHREMLTIAGQTCLNQPMKPTSLVAWPPEVGDMRQLICDAARDGVQQALTRYAFVEPRAMQAQPEAGAGSAPVHEGGEGQRPQAFDQPPSIEVVKAEFARLIGRSSLRTDLTESTDPGSIGERVSLLERLRFLADTLGGEQADQQPQKHPRMPLPADLPSAKARSRGGDFSIAALRDLIGRFRGPTPDIEAFQALGWPVRFAGLPASTRTALIGELQDSASDVYQALMSITGSHDEALTALRRLQGVLLPRVDDDEGPYEDLGDEEEQANRTRR